MVEGLTKYPDRAPGERNGPLAAIFRFVQPYDAAIEIDLIPGQRENLPDACLSRALCRTAHPSRVAVRRKPSACDAVRSSTVAV